MKHYKKDLACHYVCICFQSRVQSLSHVVVFVQHGELLILAGSQTIPPKIREIYLNLQSVISMHFLGCLEPIPEAMSAR